MRSERTRLPRHGLAAVALLAAGFYLVFVFRSGERYDGALHFTLFDDAMISMSYARNLVAGRGLVWSTATEPVEGFTNPLWTLWMALPHALGIPAPKTSLFVMLTGVVILVANVFAVAALARRIGLRSGWTALAGIACAAFFFPTTFWTLRGMEVGALVLCTHLCALLVADLPEGDARERSRRLRILALLLAVGAALRPDFAAPGALLIGAAVWTSPAEARWRVASLLLLGLAGTTLALTAFRLGYYGDPLPNTYYLKVSGHPLGERVARGGAVLLDTVLHQLWPLLLLGLIAPFHAGFRRPLPRLLAAIGGVQIAYSVSVGGDAWEGFGFANRFLSVGAVPLLLVACLGAEVACRGRGGLAALLCVALLWVPVNLPDFVRWVREGALNAAADHRMARLGIRIRERTPEGTVIAVLWAGSIPYFAQRPAVDLLGKNDRHVAHSQPVMPLGVPGHTKYDPDWSIGELRPDLVVQAFLPGPRAHAFFERLGYRPAPEALGVYATPELLERLRP